MLISQHADVDKRVLRSIFPHADDDQLEHMIKNYMTRTAAAAYVADAAVFLASEYGKSLTGNNLVLNGKFTTL